MLSQVHSAVSDMMEQEEKGVCFLVCISTIYRFIDFNDVLHVVPVNYSYLPDDSALNSLYLTMESLSSEEFTVCPEFIALQKLSPV